MVEEAAEHWRGLSPLGVVEEEAGEGRRELIQDPQQIALCKVVANVLVRCKREPDARDRKAQVQLWVVAQNARRHFDTKIAPLLAKEQFTPDFVPIWSARARSAKNPFFRYRYADHPRLSSHG